MEQYLISIGSGWAGSNEVTLRPQYRPAVRLTVGGPPQPIELEAHEADQLRADGHHVVPVAPPPPRANRRTPHPVTEE